MVCCAVLLQTLTHYYQINAIRIRGSKFLIVCFIFAFAQSYLWDADPILKAQNVQNITAVYDNNSIVF